MGFWWVLFSARGVAEKVAHLENAFADPGE
jgi:hypothetical protein